MSKLAETDDFLTGRQELCFELGRSYQEMLTVDRHPHVIDLMHTNYINNCFESWFEYYGVGK